MKRAAVGNFDCGDDVAVWREPQSIRRPTGDERDGRPRCVVDRCTRSHNRVALHFEDILPTRRLVDHLVANVQVVDVQEVAHIVRIEYCRAVLAGPHRRCVVTNGNVEDRVEEVPCCTGAVSEILGASSRPATPKGGVRCASPLADRMFARSAPF